MTNMIARYHFSMSKADFMAKRKSGHFNGFYQSLSIYEIEATAERFLPLLKLVGSPWGWDNKEMNRKTDLLNERLSHPETHLFHLLDNNRTVGYSIITKPKQSILKNMPKAFAPNSKVIEIENLGLFPGQEGGGRGGKYFEMLFEILFKNYDYVYWSMSSTNHGGLFNYYKNKLGMTHIGTDYVPDFRKNMIEQDNTQSQAA